MLNEPPTSSPRSSVPPKWSTSDSFQYGAKNYSKIQCHECRGFGYFATECANTFRKHSRVVANFMSLSEDEEQPATNDVEEQATEEVALMTE